MWGGAEKKYSRSDPLPEILPNERISEYIFEGIFDWTENCSAVYRQMFILFLFHIPSLGFCQRFCFMPHVIHFCLVLSYTV